MNFKNLNFYLFNNNLTLVGPIPQVDRGEGVEGVSHCALEDEEV